MLRVNNLVGFGAGAANRRPTLAFKDSATSTAATVTWPSVAAGDVAILFDFADGAVSAPSAVTPSGFTNHVDLTAASTLRMMISSKVCTGSESGSLTGMNGNVANSKVMLIFEAGVSSINSSTWNAQMTAGNPAAQIVSATAGSVPLIVFGAAAAGDGGGLPGFSTASPAFDAQVTAGTLRTGYTIYNSAPADHTIDMNDVLNNALASGYLEAS